MPKITAVKPQKRPGFYNVFINGKFAFSLDNFSRLKYRLLEGKELSEGEISQIKKEIGSQKNLDDVLRFLSFRPRSKVETQRYLEKRKVDKEEVEKILQRLEGQNLLNDKEFANWWLEQRQTFRPKSLRLIKNELLKKGINKEVLTNLKGRDEGDQAYGILKKKWPALIRLGVKAARQKATGFLLRRGYNWEITRKTIDRLAQEELK